MLPQCLVRAHKQPMTLFCGATEVLAQKRIGDRSMHCAMSEASKNAHACVPTVCRTTPRHPPSRSACVEVSLSNPTTSTPTTPHCRINIVHGFADVVTLCSSEVRCFSVATRGLPWRQTPAPLHCSTHPALAVFSTVPWPLGALLALLILGSYNFPAVLSMCCITPGGAELQLHHWFQPPPEPSPPKARNVQLWVGPVPCCLSRAPAFRISL